jgi:hypothetical protein
VLVSNIAAIRDMVVVVVGVWPEIDPSTGNTTIAGSAYGTACYVGNDLFLTAAHLFDPPKPGEQYLLLRMPTNGSNVQTVHVNASVDVALGTDLDLAIMRAPGTGTSLPAATVDSGDLPDGRSVFSYGYPNPMMTFTPQGPVMDLWARACPSIISAHIPLAGGKYLMEGSTYPGESGSPVFRCSDNALVAVVQATRIMTAPIPHAPGGQVRGPTIAGPLAAIAGELASRGVKLLA